MAWLTYARGCVVYVEQQSIKGIKSCSKVKVAVCILLLTSVGGATVWPGRGLDGEWGSSFPIVVIILLEETFTIVVVSV